MIAEVEKAVSTKNARIMGDNCEGPIRAFLARYLPKVFKAATGKFRTSEGHQLVVQQEREKPHQVGREIDHASLGGREWEWWRRRSRQTFFRRACAAGAE
jgi:hypothetical protein